MGGRILSRVLVASSLTGCAQLAGIDKTSPAPPDDVSLQFQRMSVGATIVTSPLDITAFPATYLVTDPVDPTLIDRVAAPQTAIDTWRAAIPDGTPPVEFGVPDFPTPFPRVFALPNRHVLGLFGVLEHPNPVAAPAGATLTLNVTLDTPVAANEAFQVYTIGSWTQRVLTALEVPPASTTLAVTYPFSSVTSITGRPLEQLTTQDAALVVRYVGAQLTGAFEATPFDQTGTDTLAGTLAAVSAATTLDVHVDQPSAVTRFAGLVPAEGAPVFNWSVVAAPGYAIANNNGIQLQAGSLLAADPGAITAAFGNPFVGHDWRSLFTWSTGASRTFTPAGQMLPATLQTGMFQLAEPAPALSLDLPAGLPQVVTLAGTALTTDGASVTIDPVKAVEISFTADESVNTLYQLQMFELVPNAANTALVEQIAFAELATEPSFVAPPELFVVGHTYTIRAICIVGGYPALAAGDLQQRQLPLAAGFVDSGVFTVVAP